MEPSLGYGAISGIWTQDLCFTKALPNFWNINNTQWLQSPVMLAYRTAYLR